MRLGSLDASHSPPGDGPEKRVEHRRLPSEMGLRLACKQCCLECGWSKIEEISRFFGWMAPRPERGWTLNGRETGAIIRERIGNHY